MLLFMQNEIVNTLKSIYPFLSISNVRKTWSQNSSAFPDGKNILYISTNFAGVKRPLGQSCYRILIFQKKCKYIVRLTFIQLTF